MSTINNPSTWEEEEEGSAFQGHHQHNKFEDGLDSMRTCLKTQHIYTHTGIHKNTFIPSNPNNFHLIMFKQFFFERMIQDLTLCGGGWCMWNLL